MIQYTNNQKEIYEWSGGKISPANPLIWCDHPDFKSKSLVVKTFKGYEFIYIGNWVEKDNDEFIIYEDITPTVASNIRKKKIDKLLKSK